MNIAVILHISGYLTNTLGGLFSFSFVEKACMNKKLVFLLVR